MWKHFQYIAGTMSSLQRRWVQFRIRLQREVFLLSIISPWVWSFGLFTLQGLGSTDLPALWGHWSHDLLHTSHHYMVFSIKTFNWARIHNVLAVYLFIWLRTVRITYSLILLFFCPASSKLGQAFLKPNLLNKYGFKVIEKRWIK